MPPAPRPLPAPRAPPTIAAADLTPSLFARHRGRRPLLIRGLLNRSDLATWSTTLSTQLLPDATTVDAMVAKDNRTFVANPLFTDTVEISAETMRAEAQRPATDDKEEGTRYYHRQVVPTPLLPTLHVDDILAPNCFAYPDEDKAKPELIKAWISSPGCITPLHYDRCHGFLVQITGTKYFFQFDAADAPLLYPSSGASLPTHLSRVPNVALLYGLDATTGTIQPAVADPDTVQWTLNKFPKIKDADPPFGILLEPGDALYTPPGWYHEVVSVSGSVSVTVPWDMSEVEVATMMPMHMAL
ncbi:hypothetical protein AMAG_07577 [Allomyces macrogynus ATCC 38327]|uniref:JmjC domain-containing protein n=1 Tax=Allomyces macrogynus (strain ATCC 38327) TaxID=578462 RepID=A0A0L0SIS5_ALLM3|nr:hypothetical protein AMAG_07577 [Allomyces macrogynus ATCC 38327]|eukprot:KNE62349.1 hypothetical protein AMAG_07577 [Allomyces macrogynus ATCC 38327]